MAPVDWDAVRKIGEAAGAVGGGGFGAWKIASFFRRRSLEQRDANIRRIAREEVSTAMAPVHLTLQELREEIVETPRRTIELLQDVRDLLGGSHMHRRSDDNGK